MDDKPSGSELKGGKVSPVSAGSPLGGSFTAILLERLIARIADCAER